MPKQTRFTTHKENVVVSFSEDEVAMILRRHCGFDDHAKVEFEIRLDTIEGASVSVDVGWTDTTSEEPKKI